MTTIVVPFAGAAGKTRLHASAAARRALSFAMLRDVVVACAAVADTRVVTPDPDAADAALDAGAAPVADPGGGQGAAVAAVLAGLAAGPVAVVNADVPCAAPADLHALIAAVPAGGVALVEARDGTTNALALPGPDAFAPLYGPGSADRFRAHAAALGLAARTVAVPNLAEDVDTLADLRRLEPRCGTHTRAALAELEAVLS